MGCGKKVLVPTFQEFLSLSKSSHPLETGSVLFKPTQLVTKLQLGSTSAELRLMEDDFVWLQDTAAATKLIGTLTLLNQDGRSAHWEDT